MMAEQTIALKEKSGTSYWEFIFLIGAMTAVIALSIDIILPALVDLGRDFNLSNPNHPQFVISSFAISFGISQLLFGPLSDVFGRRPIIYFGLSVFTIASIAAAFCNSFWLLIILRFVQGFGAAAVRVASVAVVRDCFAGRDMARVMSFVLAALMIIPILAPALGQIILYFLTWHWVFVFLGLFGCILGAWVHIRMLETLPNSARIELEFGPIFSALREIVTNRTAFGYTVAATAFFCALFSFVTSIPQIVSDIYGRGDQFAMFFAMSATAMAIGSLFNSSFVQKFGMRSISHGSLLAFTLIGIVFLAVALTMTPSIWVTMLFIAALMLNFGFIVSNFNSIAMEPLGHVAGSAAAVMGGVHFAVGAIIGGTVGQMFDGTIIPLASAYCAVGIFAMIVIALTERGKFFGT
ncbi:MAG: multidrug effflux MFS transporter [Pseudomonadota bacterium]